MLRCSFCGYENQDGSGSCEKCKTDLVVSVASNGTMEFGEPIPDTLHLEKIPMVETLGPDAPVTEMTCPAVHLKELVESAAPSTATFAVDGTAVVAAAETPPLEATSRDTKPRLIVKRGEKIDMQYPIYSGKNYIGRTDEKPVDIDLENQEPADRIWTSRQHAVITFENGTLTIEDLNSLNGTFVNRTRVHPGQVRTLQVNDIIQIGTVQLRVILG